MASALREYNESSCTRNVYGWHSTGIDPFVYRGRLLARRSLTFANYAVRNARVYVIAAGENGSAMPGTEVSIVLYNKYVCCLAERQTLTFYDVSNVKLGCDK